MNRAGPLADRLLRLVIVILDGLGKLWSGGAALLFHLLSQLYERTTVVITTSLTFSKRAGMFDQAAISNPYHNFG